MKCTQCGTVYEGNFCPNCGAPATAAPAPPAQPTSPAPSAPVGQSPEPAQPMQPVQPTQPMPPMPTTPIAPGTSPTPQPGKSGKKPLYKRWWFWLIVAFLVFSIIGKLTEDSVATKSGTTKSTTSTSTKYTTSYSRKTTTTTRGARVTVVDFSKMSRSSISSWGRSHDITISFSEAYSSYTAKGSVVSQSKSAGETAYGGDTIRVTISLGARPTVEYTNALKKAESYSKNLHMSKQGIYDQLTSQYGEQFSAAAAQYAIDNITASWNYNALQKAKSYQKNLNMSKSRIYDQLISQYGEKFTRSQAQYAVDHLDD